MELTTSLLLLMVDGKTKMWHLKLNKTDTASNTGNVILTYSLNWPLAGLAVCVPVMKFLAKTFIKI